MKKAVRGLVAACIIAVVLLGAGYIALSLYYNDYFVMNTWINGIYCTGFSVDEVNEQLLSQTVVPETLTIVGYDQTGEECQEVVWSISMEDIMLSVDYETDLRTLFHNQNSWSWFSGVLSGENHVIEPTLSFSETGLQNAMKPILSSAQTDTEYYVEYIEDTGYVLFDGMHNRIDEQKTYDLVKNAILSKEPHVNLIESGCYYDISLSPAQVETESLWNKINAFQTSGPVYDFGSGEVQVNSAIMAGFLEKTGNAQLPLIDESNCFVLREDCEEEWVALTAKEYDTYGKVWDFKSTRGEALQVEGKTYGSTINQKQEIIWLETYLQTLVTGQGVAGVPTDEGKPGKPHTPEYTRTSYNGAVGIGDTYVEVDMGIQKLYYYQDGELMLETDVVTGNARRRWNTPEGVNYVYSKQKNRILRGANYATPVDYWMPVNGAIGIHDADWRDEFGGEIYKTDGSHGCVNVPKEVMPELYEMVELGTPVVMFYGTDPYADSDEKK